MALAFLWVVSVFLLISMAIDFRNLDASRDAWEIRVRVLISLVKALLLAWAVVLICMQPMPNFVSYEDRPSYELGQCRSNAVPRVPGTRLVRDWQQAGAMAPRRPLGRFTC